MGQETDITQLLREAGSGEEGAIERLYPVLYDELRRLAQSQLQRERQGHTLQATELVNEAYLRLVDQTRVQWQNRAHFFAVAGQAIRRILVDYARRRASLKRGGERERVSLDNVMNLPAGVATVDLVGLDAALARLEVSAPEKMRVVEMRFFAGLTHEEIAEVMGISIRTVERHWHYARAWLFRELMNDVE